MSTPDDTIKDREPRYGSFTARAIMLMKFKRIAMETPSYQAMTDAQEEGLHSIFGMISRLLNGDGGDVKSWHNIAGYALLVEDSIREQNNAPILSQAAEAWEAELKMRREAGVKNVPNALPEVEFCDGSCEDCEKAEDTRDYYSDPVWPPR